MRPIRQTVSELGVSAPIPLDIYIAPFQIGVGTTLSAGAALTYKLQYTYDDVFAPSFDASTATWFDSTDITGETTVTSTVFEVPCTAIRLNVTAHTSGSATINVIQAGRPGV